MTNQNFDARYQLLKCVAVADGIRTHNALELVTGRVVMVHLVDAAGPEEVEALQRRLGRLPQTEKARVLEIATLPAGFAVVTEFLQGMTNFPEWLAARVPDDSIELPSQVPLGASQWPIQRPTEPVSAFDVHFATAEVPTGGAPLVPPIPPAQEISTIETRQPVASRENASSLPQPIAPPATPPAAPPATPPVTPPPAAAAPPPAGDFTRMFGKQSEPVTAVPAAPTADKSVAPLQPPPRPTFVPPLVMKTPAPVAVTPPAAAPPPPPLPAPAPPTAPALGEGEFTRMFRGPAPAAPKARPEPPTPSPFVNSSPPPQPPAPSPFVTAPPVRPAAPPPLPPVAYTPLPPLPSPRPAVPSSPSADVFFGALPPVSSLPPASTPFGTPPVAPNASPIGAPLPGATGRPGGLSASPLGGAPLGSPAGSPLASPQPPAPSAIPASTLGIPGSGSPLGLPPLPPPAANAPLFPGGGGGSSASPLGAGRATPASKGGVYTEMIQRSVTPPPMDAIDRKPKEEPPAKKRSIPLGLVLVLNAVLILAVVLIAYFAFRPTPVADEAAAGAEADSTGTDSAGRKRLGMPKVPKITKPTGPAIPKLP